MRTVVVAATLTVLSSSLPAQQRVDLVALPVTVADRRDTTLVRLADSCVTLLVAGLPTIGVSVLRRTERPPLDPKTIQVARLGIYGTLERVGSDLDLKLTLIDVEIAEELRSYMYRGPDPAKVIGLGVAAAERIKAVVLEYRKRTQ